MRNAGRHAFQALRVGLHHLDAGRSQTILALLHAFVAARTFDVHDADRIGIKFCSGIDGMKARQHDLLGHSQNLLLVFLFLLLRLRCSSVWFLTISKSIRRVSVLASKTRTVTLSPII